MVPSMSSKDYCQRWLDWFIQRCCCSSCRCHSHVCCLVLGLRFGKTSCFRCFLAWPRRKYVNCSNLGCWLFSAIPTTSIAAPFERVKVILQIQGQQEKVAATGATGAAAASAPKQKHFTGALDVVAHLYKEGGLRSVFKGSVATLARDGPGSALYFATYEYMKRKLTPEGQGMSLGAISFAGGMAGVAMWVPVFPIDTIKSQLQSSTTSESIGQITRKIYNSGGIKAFFPGVGPAIARSFLQMLLPLLVSSSATNFSLQ